MLKHKILFLFIIIFQDSVLQSMDPNALSGPMEDDEFGLSSVFRSPTSVADQTLFAESVAKDEHRYRQYPQYTEVDNRLNNAFAAAVQSPQKVAALKNLSKKISDTNQQEYQELDALLKQGVSSPDKIIGKINKIKPTPNGTLAAAASLVVESMTDEIQNDMISPTKKRKLTNIRDKAAVKVPTPLLRNNAPIDVEHIQHGQLINARSGSRIFHGGHNKELAFHDGFLKPGQYVITDRSNRNIGALINGAYPKTLGEGFDDEAVEVSVKRATTIAKNPSKPDFRLSQVYDKDLVGSYQDGFKFATVFPILWINGNDLVEGQERPVARFCQLNERGKLEPTIDPRNFVKLSLATFNAMMQASNTKLKTGDDKVLIADVTKPMEIYCAEQLTRLGFNQFPSTIYGIKDNRP